MVLIPTLCLLGFVLSASANPVVDLKYAQYQGAFNATSNITNFSGMRFAAPPIGHLRFSAPQPPEPVQGVQPATAYPPRCLQAPTGSSPTNPFPQKRDFPEDSEDCLYLDVHVPGKFGEAKDLPVVVWIHGGGYILGGILGLGSPGQPPVGVANGDDLVREANGGVIAVVIQYRLGLFGFLAGEKVKEGGALNAGLLDQQFALRWVHDNIAKFGGDPSKVTIWGVSAGGGSVLQQLIANDGKTNPPLFRGAITSSVFLPSQYAYNDTIPEALYSEVVNGSNCSTASNTLDCLRDVDSAALQTLNIDINKSAFFGTFAFVPVVDGTFITERPTELIKQGKFNARALYSVTNTFEGRIFVDPSTASTVQISDYLVEVFPFLTSKQVKAGVALYKDVGQPIDQAIAIMGEAIFICPTYHLLRGFSGPKFKGEFAIPPGNHGDDYQYYFPSSNPTGVPPYNNTSFDEAFADSFLTFVRSLDPNQKYTPTITPLWPRWNDKTKTEMLFNRTEDGQPDVRPISTSNVLLKRCEFWASVSAQTAQ